jgi:hypothetical protein
MSNGTAKKYLLKLNPGDILVVGPSGYLEIEQTDKGVICRMEKSIVVTRPKRGHSLSPSITRILDFVLDHYFYDTGIQRKFKSTEA